MTLADRLARHRTGDADSLRSLATALAVDLHEDPPAGTDPIAVLDSVEQRSFEEPGTWHEVRAARDYGRLTTAEYDYLSAAVAVLTEEDP